MNRAELIEHWVTITESVFWAEERIAKEWHDKLKEAPNQPKEKQYELAQAYFRAVAEEIVSASENDEESLKELERIGT